MAKEFIYNEHLVLESKMATKMATNILKWLDHAFSPAVRLSLPAVRLLLPEAQNMALLLKSCSLSVIIDSRAGSPGGFECGCHPEFVVFNKFIEGAVVSHCCWGKGLDFLIMKV